MIKVVIVNFGRGWCRFVCYEISYTLFIHPAEMLDQGAPVVRVLAHLLLQGILLPVRFYAHMADGYLNLAGIHSPDHTWPVTDKFSVVVGLLACVTPMPADWDPNSLYSGYYQYSCRDALLIISDASNKALLHLETERIPYRSDTCDVVSAEEDKYPTSGNNVKTSSG